MLGQDWTTLHAWEFPLQLFIGAAPPQEKLIKIDLWKCNDAADLNSAVKIGIDVCVIQLSEWKCFMLGM